MAFGARNNRNKRMSKPKKEFKEELLSIDRVTRVTSGGRQLRFRAVMVIGDGKGRVALGTGKSWEVVDAIAKAVANA
ncbi:30S ribosomal protein S5, partial [Candidatus Gracilibacteria bacterium]